MQCSMHCCMQCNNVVLKLYIIIIQLYNTTLYNIYIKVYIHIQLALEQLHMIKTHLVFGCKCWVHKYRNLTYQIWKKRNKNVQLSWKLDETYIKIKGKWCYLYRAIDKDGHALDIQLRKKRDYQSDNASVWIYSPLVYQSRTLSRVMVSVCLKFMDSLQLSWNFHTRTVDSLGYR